MNQLSVTSYILCYCIHASNIWLIGILKKWRKKPNISGLMKHSYKLIYFSSRGRAEPIRLLLHYFGEEFEEEHLSEDQWGKVKKSRISCFSIFRSLKSKWSCDKELERREQRSFTDPYNAHCYSKISRPETLFKGSGFVFLKFHASLNSSVQHYKFLFCYQVSSTINLPFQLC